jgi:hypothetical protein
MLIVGFLSQPYYLNLNGKIEQRVQDVAPSSEIGDDDSLEVLSVHDNFL